MQDYNLSQWISEIPLVLRLLVMMEKLCQKREKLHFTSESGSGYKEKKQFSDVFFFFFKWLKYKSQNVVRFHHNLGKKLNKTRPGLFCLHCSVD